MRCSPTLKTKIHKSNQTAINQWEQGDPGKARTGRQAVTGCLQREKRLKRPLYFRLRSALDLADRLDRRLQRTCWDEVGWLTSYRATPAPLGCKIVR